MLGSGVEKATSFPCPLTSTAFPSARISGHRFADEILDDLVAAREGFHAVGDDAVSQSRLFEKAREGARFRFTAQRVSRARQLAPRRVVSLHRVRDGAPEVGRELER